MQIMWFKRDLRIADNLALTLAAQNGPLIPLYIIEPELWQQPDLSYRQYLFLNECLLSLDLELQSIGQKLIIRVGDAVSVLNDIVKNYPITDVWSHQETWNWWTYERDKKVKIWLKIRGISWHEPRQNGVIRKLVNRDGWKLHWDKYMKQPTIARPKLLQSINIISEILPTPNELNLLFDGIIDRQIGGRTQGILLLKNFLYQRGIDYSKEMSSPLTAFDSCSRLSPYLAFGTISIRETFHALKYRTQELKQQISASHSSWYFSLRSFSARLVWHCHFIQKLEDEPQIEFNNMHYIYNGLREEKFNDEYFQKWKEGKTGYPMIDACMRALIATGWINFRMRAMLISFASYNLWLDWRKTAPYLASLFTDYEPGIHYSQVQMQSGTTGINSLRIYSPIKQSIDHDPNGVFIRQWISELANMPVEYIHEPWHYPLLMNGYPKPLVNEKASRLLAIEKLYKLRQTISHKKGAINVLIKHGSRKRRLKFTNKSKQNQENNSQQMELPFDSINNDF